MKKILYNLLVVSVMCCFSSCKGEPGIMGPMGPQGPAGPSPVVHTVHLTIPYDAWEKTQQTDNNYFLYTFDDIDELTDKVCDVTSGSIVKMYRMYPLAGSTRYSQLELPYVRPIEYLIDEQTQSYGSYIETVDYEFSVNTVTIAYTASDFFYSYQEGESFVPDTMEFRLVIME